MNTTKTECCQCSRLDNSSISRNWCLDCEESLCTDCSEIHKVCKPSMKHSLVDIETASALPTKILVPQKHCIHHTDLIIDFLCVVHDAVCCHQCILDTHRACDRIIPLELVCKDTKQSALYTNTSERIKSFDKGLKEILKKYKENKKRIDKQKREISKDIANFKEIIVNKLEDLEKKSLLSLERIYRRQVIDIENYKKQIEISTVTIETYLQQLEFISTHGTDRNIFLFLHKLQPILSKEEIDLEKILSKISDINLVYIKPDDILSKNRDLGIVNVQYDPCHIQYCLANHLGAHQTHLNSEESVFVFNSICGPAFGMVITNDNNLITTEGNHLVIYNTKGHLIDTIPLGSISVKAYDIAYNADTEKIVVSLRENGIQIRNLKNVSKRSRCTSIPGTFYGVTWVKENIFACGRRTYFIYDVRGNMLKRMRLGRSILNFLHCSSEYIYISEFTNDTIYCINKDGSIQFTFKSAELIGPDGITTDRQGNVYVVGRITNNVHRLSQDGRKSDIILQENDGTADPITICFDKDYKKMYISNCSGYEIRGFRDKNNK